ncbi:MAG: hypothetical protein ACXQTV_04670 [Candidatus Hecatellaceae archaeon]
MKPRDQVKLLSNLKSKLILFLLGFFTVFSFLPCRGVGCASCGLCFFAPITVLGAAYASRIKKRLKEAFSWLRRGRRQQ